MRKEYYPPFMLTRKEITTGKLADSILKSVRVGIPQRKKVVE